MFALGHLQELFIKSLIQAIYLFTCYSDSCPSEILGVFSWPETKVGSTVNISCPNNPRAVATRECQNKWNKVNSSKEIAWGSVDAKACSFGDRNREIFNLLKVFSLIQLIDN